MVEHIIGRDEVISSILIIGSKREIGKRQLAIPIIIGTANLKSKYVLKKLTSI